MQAAERLIVKPSTIAAMERWVRWRFEGSEGSSGIYLGSGSGGLLGRLQSGKRRRKCPRCNGWRRIFIAKLRRSAGCPKCDGAGYIEENLEVTGRVRPIPCPVCWNDKAKRSLGEVNSKTCLKCGGRCEIFVGTVQVHPSLIPGTRVYGRGMTDPISSLINVTVMRWQLDSRTHWLYWVVIECYAGSRSQTDIAKSLGVSDAWVSRYLKQAHLAIQEVIENYEKSYRRTSA